METKLRRSIFHKVLHLYKVCLGETAVKGKLLEVGSFILPYGFLE